MLRALPSRSTSTIKIIDKKKILDNELQRLAHVRRRACDDAVVHVPQIEEEVGALCPRRNLGDNAVKDQGK